MKAQGETLGIVPQQICTLKGCDRPEDPLKLRPFRAYNFSYPDTQGYTLGFRIQPFQGKYPTR